MGRRAVGRTVWGPRRGSRRGQHWPPQPPVPLACGGILAFLPRIGGVSRRCGVEEDGSGEHGHRGEQGEGPALPLAWSRRVPFRESDLAGALPLLTVQTVLLLPLSAILQSGSASDNFTCRLGICLTFPAPRACWPPFATRCCCCLGSCFVLLAILIAKFSTFENK